MRRLFLFCCSLLWFFTLTAQSGRVLFIGNSYIYVNNLPEMIQQCCTSSGGNLDFTMSAPGGYDFRRHCSYSLGQIQSGDYDVVVLQEQSQLPSFPEQQFLQESYPYAMQLCDLIRQYNPNAKIFFYMTWGRKNGDAQNCQFYPPLCTYEGMDSLLYARYMMMAQDNHACVSPVGAVWHYIRDHYPDLELYQSDESHPSYFGSYVAACCFYASLTGQNPLDIHWNGILTSSQANIAKMAVKTVVFDSLSKWCFEESPIVDDSTAVPTYISTSPSIEIYPNPVANSIYIKSDIPLEDVVVEVFDLSGRRILRYDHFNADSFDVGSLENGLYLMKIRATNFSYQTRFSVIH